MLLRLKFSLNMPKVKLSSLYVIVARRSIKESTSLKYLGLIYGPGKYSTRIFTAEYAISGFRTSYAKHAALKYSYSKRVLAKLHSALSLPYGSILILFGIRCLKRSSYGSTGVLLLSEVLIKIPIVLQE